MIAGDIMVRDPVSVRPEGTLSDVVQLMIDRRVSGIPVTDANGRLVGIVTEGDLLRRVETGTEKRASWLQVFFTPGRVADDYVQTHGTRIAEVMTPEVFNVTEATPLEEVVTLMKDKHIKRVPVTRNGILVGIVSRADLVKALGQILSAPDAPVTSDAQVREKIYAELERQAWTPKGIRVTVENGAVELDGTIFDERDRDAIRVAAENVPGVKSVKDHLVWVEPNSGMIFVPEDPGSDAATKG
jgi:CBS domain-containing protein